MSKMADLDLDMQDRAVKALRRTNQVIGVDMGWNDREPSARTLREVVPDGNCLELYGNDPEAVGYFRTLDKGARTALLKRAFP